MNAMSSSTAMKPSRSSPSYARPGRRVSQFGVSSRSESQRSVLQVLATSPRSSTTWSTPRPVRTWLTARPAWPAPMTTTGTCVTLGARSVDRDADVRRVRDDVEDRGALLGLRHERLDVLRGGVGVDVEVDADVVEAVAHLGIAAQDAEDVHVALDAGLHRLELDVAVLRDGGHAGGQAGRQPDEDVLDRGRAVVLGGEHLGVIGGVAEARLVAVGLAQPRVVVHRGLGAGAPDPLRRCAPGELGRLGGVGQRGAGAQQMLDVDAVVGHWLGGAHRDLLVLRLVQTKTRSSLTTWPLRGPTRAGDRSRPPCSRRL